MDSSEQELLETQDPSATQESADAEARLQDAVDPEATEISDSGDPQAQAENAAEIEEPGAAESDDAEAQAENAAEAEEPGAAESDDSEAQAENAAEAEEPGAAESDDSEAQAENAAEAEEPGAAESDDAEAQAENAAEAEEPGAAESDDAEAQAENAAEAEEPGAAESDDSEAQAEGVAEAERPQPPPEARWYVIHSYSGYENKVQRNLEQRIETQAMQDRVFRVVVPTEEEIEIRDGQRRTVRKRVFPGYIFVQMIMDDDSWYVVRNTPAVTGFVGPGTKPTPISDEEVDKILSRMEVEQPRIKVSFRVGESVRITEGPFADFVAMVDELYPDRGKVRLLVSFFGRETPVEMDFLQVEPI